MWDRKLTAISRASFCAQCSTFLRFLRILRVDILYFQVVWCRHLASFHRNEFQDDLGNCIVLVVLSNPFGKLFKPAVAQRLIQLFVFVFVQHDAVIVMALAFPAVFLNYPVVIRLNPTVFFVGWSIKPPSQPPSLYVCVYLFLRLCPYLRRNQITLNRWETFLRNVVVSVHLRRLRS
jgi:hypothetical protein